MKCEMEMEGKNKCQNSRVIIEIKNQNRKPFGVVIQFVLLFA